MDNLTAEQKAKFYRDGYLNYGRVLSMSQVEALRAGLDRTMASEITRADYTALPPEFAYGHRRSAEDTTPRAIHQFVNIWKVCPEFANIRNTPAIAQTAAALMHAPSARLWHDQVISKPPGDNDHFSTHHDFYFWPLDKPTMVTCWIALDDASPANGCMHVFPGSHRDPRLQPRDCSLTPELGLTPQPAGPGAPASLYDEIRTWREDKAVPVALKAGECMFHHCLNYHLTPRNTTQLPRRAYVLIYMPPDTRYNRAQSPNHPCTQHLALADGAELPEAQFPTCDQHS